MKVYIILGHADQNGQIDNDCEKRVAFASQLAHGPDDYLILCGGRKSTYPDSEAKQMQALLTGWDPERVILEERSRTTAENAWCSQDLLRASKETILITSRSHSFRSRYFFHRARQEYGLDYTIRGLASHNSHIRDWLYEFRAIKDLGLNIIHAREWVTASASSGENA